MNHACVFFFSEHRFVSIMRILCSFRTLKLRPSVIDFQDQIHFWVQHHILKSSLLVHSTKFLAYIFFNDMLHADIRHST